MALPNVLVCDGDSLTSGSGVTHPWPYYLALNGPWTVYNVAVGGETLVTMNTNAPTNVDAKYQAGVGNVCIIWGGINDIIGGATGAQVYATLQTYCAGRRAAGFKVICTTMPSFSSGTDAARDAFNTLVAANWNTFADGCVRLDLNPDIGPDGSYTNSTYYQTTGMFVGHLNENSYQNIVAPLMSAAVNGLSVAISVVQTCKSGTYQSHTAAFGSNNAAGNAIVVMGFANSASVVCSDSQGNTYRLITTQSVWAGSFFLYAFVAFGVKPGANTVTMSPTNGVITSATEVSGVSSLDQFTSNTGSATLGGVFTSPTLVTSNPNEIVFFEFMTDVSSSSSSVISPLQPLNSGAATNYSASGYLSAGMAGSYSGSEQVAASGLEAGSIVFSLNASVPGATGFVQGVSVGPTSGSSATLSFASNNTKGNLLFLSAGFSGGGVSFSSVSDSQGNSWSAVASPVNLQTSFPTQGWFAPNCKGGANTITVQLSGAATYVVSAAEYQGVAANPLDVAGSPLTGTGTALTGNSVTPTKNGDLIIGYGVRAVATIAPGTLFGLDQADSQYTFIESLVQSTATAIAATATIGTSKNWVLGTVAFKGAPASIGGGGNGLSLAMDASLRNSGLRH